MAIDMAFDRIAPAYDAQRAHPAEISRQIARAIIATAGVDAQILELGVGTGRIALPVVAAGGRVTGVDLAREMLHVARKRLAGGPGAYAAPADTGAGAPAHLRLVQGDVARLPLRGRSFDAVLGVHVLHLVPDWRGALAEVARVLRPGGAFIQGRDWRDPQSCGERLRAKLREVVIQLRPGARPPGAGAALAQSISRLGGTTAPEQIAAEWSAQISPAAVLSGMAARADAETWALDDALLAAAVARVRAWAEATWEDLAAEQTIQQRFILTVTRGAWDRPEL